MAVGPRLVGGSGRNMDDGDPELAAAIALSLGLTAGGAPGNTGVEDAHGQRTLMSTDVTTPSSRGGWLASPAPAASAEGSPDTFVGRFSRRPIVNAWHGGSITLSVQGRLRWDNDAGVSDTNHSSLFRSHALSCRCF